jgi:hypothetical protein
MICGVRPEPPDSALQCSAKGCRNAATWQLRWNNPRLHTPDRRKTWLACDAHRESLSTFLGARGFLRETMPAQADAEADPDAGPHTLNG